MSLSLLECFMFPVLFPIALCFLPGGLEKARVVHNRPFYFRSFFIFFFILLTGFTQSSLGTEARDATGEKVIVHHCNATVQTICWEHRSYGHCLRRIQGTVPIYIAKSTSLVLQGDIFLWSLNVAYWYVQPCM